MKIRSKILLVTFTTLLISLMISNFIVTKYFVTVATERDIEDERVMLSQQMMQIEYLAQNIRMIGASIVIDSDIQEFSRDASNLDSVTKNKKLTNIKKRLADYALLTDYIRGVSIITSNEVISYPSSILDSYVEDLNSHQWLVEFRESGEQNGFSEVHEMNELIPDLQVITYIIRYKDVKDLDSELGTLLISIPIRKFEELFIDEPESNPLVWLNEQKVSLFEKNNQYEESQSDDDDWVIKSLNNSDEVSELRNGFVISNNQSKNGWMLLGYISKNGLNENVSILWSMLLIVVVFSVLIFAIIILVLISRITKPITLLSEAMHKVSNGNLDVAIDINSHDEMEELGVIFNDMTDKIKDYLEITIQQEREKNDLELDVLMMQINPHFIYNTLTSIIYLARKERNEDIIHLTKDFITILQDIVRIGNGESSAQLYEEIDVSKKYISVQTYRYPNKFVVSWDIDEKLLSCIVPKTILQPLIENAIYHGFGELEKIGKIHIRIYEDNGIIIDVIDNGVGMNVHKYNNQFSGDDFSKKGMRSIGINNILRRIQLAYGMDFGINIESKDDNGTKITVHLPVIFEN